MLLWVLFAFTADGGVSGITNDNVVIGGQTWETTALYTNGLPYHLATNAVRRTRGIANPATAMPYLYSNGNWSQVFYQYKPFRLVGRRVVGWPA